MSEAYRKQAVQQGQSHIHEHGNEEYMCEIK